MSSLTLFPLETIRTNNFKSNVVEDIGLLWQRNKDKLSSSSPNYAIYHHYESDFKGDYNITIALENKYEKCKSIIKIDDLTFYEIFKTTNQQLINTWQNIWIKEQQGLLKRAYKIDFEKHHLDGKVEIFISITPHC